VGNATGARSEILFRCHSRSKESIDYAAGL
jgi:hypothetical protein